ncbi:PSD1 and planctomycete cytochrome C domain-containing protein [Rapidithrix thailandica]|uniref:PSD1 and planctomycete cytochrome C domain-containing protein n=1 Tax=Rapidithrix thailandica TaxID=413964 RepID=A0AAW9S4W3_9BACT
MTRFTVSLFTMTVFSCEMQQKVDFNAEIRPIINSKCISCHGGVKKSGGFSLLFRSEALAPTESGSPAILPGEPENSELIKRIQHHDPELRMPLDASPLSDKEIRLLTQWIEQGAEWEDHWAFVSPKPVSPPEPEDLWVQNAIDPFVLDQLQDNGLQPNPKADKATLLRRVSLDLTGIPPSPEQVRHFEEDTSGNAYEKVVDRLLASPQYGERWAAMWLDLARYADSKGYEADRHRDIWRYRDWVIEAFNQDMPFDQFTIEQLAGDLLPNSTREQQIATAFHRNTMTNDEGGTDDEEFRVAAVLDRVNTTWDVWQGVTFACVQCHSHPYDPFRHKEYYQFYAFFNQTEDSDKYPDEPPFMLVYQQEEDGQRKQIQAYLDSLTRSGETTRKSQRQIARKEEELKQLKAYKLPVMKELSVENSRKTHVFDRGNWLTHGEEVWANVPGSLPSMPADAPANRLGMAQWLVSEENPLTARVTVNRFWGQLFGKGFVETQEDFGSQGFKPTHPELLDYLALHFIHEQKWSVKKLLKMMVMSATYQQSSKVRPEVLDKDPYNYLLARGPRFRLTAEQLRDQALAVSGLLSTKMYGPSVMPPQPEGIWQVVYNGSRWVTSQGEDRYRRALYTYIRRTSPYPSMITFDGPSREFCLTRRINTNTPLQALVTLNDPVYLEAAQALAKHMREKGGEQLQEKIRYGYEKVLLKSPSSKTLQTLTALYHESQQHYQDSVMQAVKQTDNPSKAFEPELAGLTVVANAMMNLDSFIMKE